MSQYGATLFGGYERYSIEKEWRESAGTLLFIGIFLSVIFLLATVLVIYYKQISEGYEDRDNFVILQQVGLDQKQTSTTIRKQILTVFFLPFILLLPLPRSGLQDDCKDRCPLRSNQCGLGPSNDSFYLRCLFHLLYSSSFF